MAVVVYNEQTKQGMQNPSHLNYADPYLAIQTP